MLRCCAGICGGGGGAAARTNGHGNGERKVVKPDLPDGEEYASEGFPEDVAMEVAPPGATDSDIAGWVTPGFQRNTARLVVFVPSLGAPEHSWDARLEGGRGASKPLLRWAMANSCAVAVFRAEALEANPAAAWEAIMKGSPARCVAVVVAAGSLPLVHSALLPVHPLLYSRVKTVCVRWGDEADSIEGSAMLSLPTELRVHLRAALVQMPPAWADMEPFAMHQVLFQLLFEREERFSAGEAKKYWGFQGMKENDMPGLKRMSMETRIKRLERDRNNDELARILRKNEEAMANVSDGEDEPGVD